MVLVMLAGCSGQGPELSPWSETDTSDLESSTDPSDGETTLVTEPTGMDTTPGPGPSRMTETTTGIEPTTGSVSECGNGQIEQGEECDGSDLDGQTCESLGQAPGSVACTADCRLDLSGCVPPGMVLVPAGEFTRGSEQMLDEQPVCQVTLGAYWIDEREVTLDDYAACMDAGECVAPTGLACNWGVDDRGEHPVNCVTWFDARRYCEWVDGGTKRLPTEAEWEKAARGTDARVYPWGDQPPDCCLAVMSGASCGDGGSGWGCGTGTTWPTGSKSPQGDSPYGAQDMAGNVREWVWDFYAGSYSPEGECAAAIDDPTGPDTGNERVVRGGGFFSAVTLRAADRESRSPDNKFLDVGFRCARTPPIAPD